MGRITCCLLCCLLRSELWRLGPRSQRHHREPGVPARVPQLRQLHVGHRHGRAQPDTAVLPHVRARGRLRHPVGLRRTAPTRELESQVKCRLFPVQIRLRGATYAASGTDLELIFEISVSGKQVLVTMRKTIKDIDFCTFFSIVKDITSYWNQSPTSCIDTKVFWYL